MAKHSERLMKVCGDIKALPYRDLIALADAIEKAVENDYARPMPGVLILAALAINPDEPAVTTKVGRGKAWGADDD